MTLTDAWRRYLEHRYALDADPGYACVITELAKRVLERDHATPTVDADVFAELAGRMS